MSDFAQRLHRAVRDERLAPLELALADWSLRHGGSEPVALAMALTQRAVAEGHSCLLLPAEGPAVPGEAPFCSSAALLEALSHSPLVGTPGADRPLILDGRSLYLHRYWRYEAGLAARLTQLLAQPPAAVDTAPLTRTGGLFDYGWISATETHWQAVAAAVALRQRFTVISGGPGTGKTYTVLRLIQLLVDAAASAGQPQPVIRLAAPTGKAAARMMESIRAGLDSLPTGALLRERLPERAATLHRLLGIGGGSVLPRHHRDNPLPADVVIVDEASMIDLPMMAKLADALPDRGRLILLGDRYQLASVESGSVLAELCAAAGVNAFSTAQQAALTPLLQSAAPHPADPAPLADHVVTLETSHRFHAQSPIGRLARAVNAGDADAAFAVGRETHDSVTVTPEGNPDLERLADALADAYAPLHSAATPTAALAALDRIRLLTATRVGPAGAIAMNQRIFAALAARHDIDGQPRWYHGRPVLVTHNDYRAGLFNGDTGVCLADNHGQLRVWFRTEDGLQSLLPSAMPAHETAYAMTVHKSQGSEFDAVWLLLPPVDGPVLSRELVYTGITRARTRITVLGGPDVFRAGISRVIQRDSGLAARLQQSS